MCAFERGEERPSAHAGTVEEQVGRFRELAEAGVQEVFVALHGVVDPDGGTGQLERFAAVIDAFG